MALAAVRRYRRVMNEELDKILVTTMNDVPGYEIVAVYGEVFGLIVRARNVFSNFGASLRTLVGGEVGGYTTLLSDSRNHAIERLRSGGPREGRQRGGCDALRLQRNRESDERDRGLRHRSHDPQEITSP